LPERKVFLCITPLGLVPEEASTRLVGHQRASEILLLGAPLSAHEAQATGFVNRVISDQPVRDFALARANRLTQLPQGAILWTKALLKHPDEVLERIELEAEAFVARTKSSAAREAFAAFLEKRKPNFADLD